MYTDDQIRSKLAEDPNWEPADDASDKDWELYDEIYEEMRASGELTGEAGDDVSGEESNDGYGDDDW